MTEDEYVAEMDALERMLATLHTQVNAIADREAAATAAQHPLPYQNDRLTATKHRLVASSAKIIDAMETLHKKWAKSDTGGGQ